MVQKLNDITLQLVFSTVKVHGKQIVAGVLIVSLATFLLMLTVPDYYRGDEVVGYEEESSTIAEGLRTVGLSQGFDTGRLSQNTDAFFPPHYFLLLESNEFLARALRSQITTEEGESMTYYKYLLLYPQRTWWQSITHWIISLGETPASEDINEIDPTHLTPQQAAIFENASRRLLCRANTNKNMVTVSVIDRDPFVCATMATTVRSCIQEFVESYRRKKMEEQAAFYTTIMEQAEKDYQVAVREFNNYSQPHSFASRPKSRVWENHLRLKMMQKETILNAMRTHHDLSINRLSEPTSLFTPIKKAAIPVKPEGPKRFFNTLLAALLTLILMVLYFIRKPLFQQLK